MNTPGKNFVLAVMLCCFCQWTRAQETPRASLGVDDRAFIAAKIFAFIQNYFYLTNADRGGLDAPFRKYLRVALSADERRQFDFCSMEFVAQLHNGHTFWSDSWLNAAYGQPLGFFAVPLSSKWVIESSSVAGLMVGDVVTKIDGEEIEHFFRRQQKYISASSVTAQRYNLFLAPYLFLQRFTLSLEDGREVVFDRATTSNTYEPVDSHWLEQGDTAYIRISSFFNPSYEDQALEGIRRFAKAEKLVIDVRRNPGGIPPFRLIRALMDRPYRGWKESTRIRVPFLESFDEVAARPGPSGSSGQQTAMLGLLANRLGSSQLSWDAEFVPQSPLAYRGRLVILIDEGCVSACEDFVEPFKDNGRATLIGRTTQGSSGTPFFYDFGNGMSLKIAVKREYFPDGSEFEGIGIKPDIEVRPSIEDLKNGRDVVLESALELARH